MSTAHAHALAQSGEATPGPLQDLEGLCREAGKHAADWAASIRSTAELADETGYELCSGRNRSLVAVKSEKRERTRQVMHGAQQGPSHVLCMGSVLQR